MGKYSDAAFVRNSFFLSCSDCSTSFFCWLVAGRKFQLYFLFILFFFATYITTMSAPAVCYFCSLHLCQDVLLVGFFLFLLLTYVLCYAAALLSGVRVYMDLDIFYFPFFCLVFLLAVEKPEGKSQFFFFGVLYGLVFFFCSGFSLFYFCITLLLFVSHSIYECRVCDGNNRGSISQLVFWVVFY